ncbi:hypothetical protein [Bosea sp. CRIB-10]|uniref:hypothetical protein n=1 Tax=Bosea sp. CRIB-10 TaxID=378404 RepID=UPI001113719C|nr:hypothetical protein [Bosea sp. CRIB-10]
MSKVNFLGMKVMADNPRPPRRAGNAAAIAVSILATMVVALFIGFNLHHAETLRERQSGQVDPRDAPKSPTDLQVAPVKPNPPN